MKLEQRYIDRLKDLNGSLPNGEPKLRVVTPKEAVRPHGALKGQPKYFDPTSNAQMPFLVLEQWLPAMAVGGKEHWNYELLGAHPSECDMDCCSRGFWGFYLPLTNELGEYIPFTEQTMDAIERHISVARRYAGLTEKERLEALDADLSAANTKKDEIAILESNDAIEHYLNHKEELDNADNRVIIGLGKNALPDVKGGKEAIGSPIQI